MIWVTFPVCVLPIVLREVIWHCLRSIFLQFGSIRDHHTSFMKYLCLIFAVLAVGLAGCRTKGDLVLLKPERDIHMARPVTLQTNSIPEARVPQTLEKGPIIEVETNMGNFAMVLDPDKAPITVANFLQYVKDGFYTNTLFHRVVPGFVIQGGGYTIAMEEKATRPPIKNESATSGLRNRRGTVAMARRDNPDSATAQFFINLEDNPFLNADGPYGGYAVFARVIEGMETVDKIAGVSTATQNGMENMPKEPVIIRRVFVRE